MNDLMIHADYRRRVSRSAKLRKFEKEEFFGYLDTIINQASNKGSFNITVEMNGDYGFINDELTIKDIIDTLYDYGFNSQYDVKADKSNGVFGYLTVSW